MRFVLLFLMLLGVACGAEEAPPTEELISDEDLSISPWHWHSTPVIEPGGSLWLGFTATNPTLETVTGGDFWGKSTLTLISLSGATQTVPGARMLEVGDYIGDMEPGAGDTAVVKIEDLFSFTETGPHVLRWETPFGVMDYIVMVLDGLDYLYYRLENDVVYNEWGLYLYGMDGVFLSNSLATRVLAFGEEAIDGLAAFLDSEKECSIEGSEEATIGSMYEHRVKDYAAIMLAVILGAHVPELRSMDPAERDAGVEKVRLLLTEGGY